MSNPLVSIITVCYNSEATVSRTIESVLKQTYSNIEYIIVDGASKDGTMDIINSYKKRAKSMKIISEPDRGIYDAMNKGIRMSSGEIIGIVNSDDYYESDAVECIVKKYLEFENRKRLIIYGYERNMLRGEEVEVVFYHHRNLEKKNINHPTCFVTRNTYDYLGLFDLKYKSAADYDFLLRAYFDKSILFIPIEKIISNFELGGTSLSGLGLAEQAEILYRRRLINRREFIIRKIWARLFFIKKSIVMR